MINMLIDIGFHGEWDDWIMGLAALATSVVVIWQKVIKPIVTAAMKAGEIADTLKDIAVEFKPNHGHSLKDVLASIDKRTDELAAKVTEDLEELHEGQIAILQQIEQLHANAIVSDASAHAGREDARTGREYSTRQMDRLEDK